MNDKQYMLLLANAMEKASGGGVGEDFFSMTYELVEEIIAELRRRGTANE